MAVADAVQTFAGITNENEFYSHHYLAEVFKGDIKTRIDAWVAREGESGSQNARSPFKQHASCGTRWFALKAYVPKRHDSAERLGAFAELQQGLLLALGYSRVSTEHDFVAGSPVPVWQVLGDAQHGPRVVAVPAYNPGQEDDD